MIQFRQKIFFVQALAPLLIETGISTGVMAGVQGIQGHKANKIAEEQGEEQMKQNEIFQKQQMKQNEQFQKQQMKMQEKSALIQARAIKSAANTGSAFRPVPIPQTVAYSDCSEQREYANAAIFKPVEKVANRLANSGAWKKVKGNGVYKDISGFASDVGQVAKANNWAGKAAGFVGMGSVMTAGAYGVDKAIQANMKKSGKQIEEDNQSQEEKKPKSKIKTGLAIGAGTLGTAAGTLVLARKGKLNMQTLKNVGSKLGNGVKEQFVTKPATKEEVANARKKLKMVKNDPNVSERTVKKATSELNNVIESASGKPSLNKGSIIFTAGLSALPAVGYISQKSAEKRQIEEQQNQQRSYSVISTVGRTLKPIGSKIKKGASWLGNSTVDMLSFGAGRPEQEMLGTQLKNLNKGSGSRLTQKVANGLTSGKHKGLKTAGGIVAGLTVISSPMVFGDKVTRKALQTVDKDAFKYEKSQGQQVPNN